MARGAQTRSDESTDAGGAAPCKGPLFPQRRLLIASRNPPSKDYLRAESRTYACFASGSRVPLGLIIYSGHQ
jgi:hypothetical protein